LTREFVCNSESDTLLLGERIARALPNRAFLTMRGGLGAGKTVLVRGMGKAYGIDRITSPTFTIVQEYESEPCLLHFDAYRLTDSDELYAIGYDDYLRQEAVIVMEWAEIVPDAVPHEHLEITIEGSGEEARVITLTAISSVYEEVLKRI